MTAPFTTLTRPKEGADHAIDTRHRPAGFALGFVGLGLAAITLIANIAAANSSDPVSAAETLAWSFGLATTAFGTIKLAISVILIGILIRLWHRVTAVTESLRGLKPDAEPGAPAGDVDTDFGTATKTSSVPDPLPGHDHHRVAVPIHPDPAAAGLMRW